MKIEVICPEKKGWCLHRIASAWAAAMYCEVRRSPSETADVRVWLGYSVFGRWAARYKKGGKDVVLFTHREDAKIASWVRANRWADMCVCQSERHRKMLDQKKVFMLSPGWDKQFVFGRERSNDV